MNENIVLEQIAPETEHSDSAAVYKHREIMRNERNSEPFERYLLLGALAIAMLFDRLIAAATTFRAITCGYALFWLGYLIVFYIFNWERAKKRIAAWYVAAVCALMCVWLLLYAQANIQLFTHLLLPLGLMLHAQLGVLSDTEPMTLFANVFFGFFAQPFTALGKPFNAFASLISGKHKRASYVAAGILAAVPVAGIILALLFSADGAFSYFGARLIDGLNLGNALFHIVCIFAVLILFYSLLWNLKYRPENYYAPKPPAPARLEPLAVGIVLSVLLAIYLLFSIVQVAFLFGGARLPEGITYSEYARSGFFQLIAASALNFLIFALALRYTKPSRAIRWLLLGLLIATGMLLVSGVTRLWMYIAAYGLTWMRVAPMWFMAYLAVALIMGGVRLFMPKFKLFKACAAVLMAAALMLAFINVDKAMARYNMAMGELDLESQHYVYSLSNDCIDELIACPDGHENIKRENLKERLFELRHNGAYTLSDILAWQKLEEWYARQ